VAGAVAEVEADAVREGVGVDCKEIEIAVLIHVGAEEFQKGFGSEPNVLDDLAEQVWRDVSCSVKWDSRHATVGMAKRFVRSALTNLHEAELSCGKRLTSGETVPFD